jgi:NADPH:quinone reductase-like Zn-dependent oxidoreductase
MTSSPATMRAVRLSAPGPVDNLRLTTLPLPPERDGWVRIRVEAFGLNRSELKLRLGLSVGVSFPGCRVSRPPVPSTRPRAAAGWLPGRRSSR